MPERAPEVDLAIVQVDDSADDAGFRELEAIRGLPSAPALVAASARPSVNALLRALRAGVADFLTLPVSLPDALQALRRARRPPLRAASAEPRLLPLHVVESEHVLAVLAAVGGNKQQAAKILRVDRKTLYRRLRRLRGPPAGAD